MNISGAAKTSELPTKTVRYYSEIGLVEPKGRSAAGYRIYSDRDVQKLAFVRRARAFGFSLDECRELLSLYEDENRPSFEVKRIASEKLLEIERKRAELDKLHAQLSKVVKACNGNEKPDCPIIDLLG